MKTRRSLHKERGFQSPTLGKDKQKINYFKQTRFLKMLFSKENQKPHNYVFIIKQLNCVCHSPHLNNVTNVLIVIIMSMDTIL